MSFNVAMDYLETVLEQEIDEVENALSKSTQKTELLPVQNSPKKEK